MSADTPSIVKAVLAGDVRATENCLAAGASPNLLWGTLPLITHAALIHNLPIFRLLLERGAVLPDDILNEVVSWELGDWRITTPEEEAQFVSILDDIRSTKAWLSAPQRSELAATLDGYGLDLIVSALRQDEPQTKIQTIPHSTVALDKGTG